MYWSQSDSVQSMHCITLLPHCKPFSGSQLPLGESQRLRLGTPGLVASLQHSLPPTGQAFSGFYAFAQAHFLLGNDFLSLHYLCLTDSSFMKTQFKCSLFCEAISDFLHNLEEELASPSTVLLSSSIFFLFTCLSVSS